MVARVAFNLRRAVLMRLDENRLVGEFARKGRSVEGRDTRNRILGLLRVRQRVITGLTAAGEAKASQTEGSAHQHQELASFDGSNRRGTIDELAFGTGPELGRLIALFEAAPIDGVAGLSRGMFKDFLAHRLKSRG